MLPTSSEGNTSTLARPLRGLLGALECATPGTMAASACSSPSRMRSGAISLAISVARITLSTRSWRALPLVEKLSIAKRGSMPAMSRAVCAADTAICASSSAVGSGTTAQSAKTSMPSVPKLSPSGSSMRKAPETTLMPGCVLITWNAARSTLPVVFCAPATCPSASPAFTIRQPRYSGLAVVRRASSMVMPLFLRSSKKSGA